MIDSDRYDLGLAAGKAILALFRVIAAVDDVTVQEAMDSWVATYFAERVSQID